MGKNKGSDVMSTRRRQICDDEVDSDRNGVPSDEVNKQKKRTLRGEETVSEPKVLKKTRRNVTVLSPVKSPKIKKKKADVTPPSVARFRDDNKFVTLQVEGMDQEFEEGEIGFHPLDQVTAGPSAVQPSVTAPREAEMNSNANRVLPVTYTQHEMNAAIADARRVADMKKAEDEKELQEVTKRIAGQTFALVKEMSGFLDAASMVKEHLNRSQGEAVEQSSSSKGEHLSREQDSQSVSTIYEKAVVTEVVGPAEPNVTPKRVSTSSEDTEQMDTSDETNFDIVGQIDQLHLNDIITAGGGRPSGGRDMQLAASSGHKARSGEGQ